MESDLGSGPEKVAQIPRTQAQHWVEKSLDIGIHMLWEFPKPNECMHSRIKGASESFSI